MSKNTLFPLEASHERFSAIETETGLPGTFTFHVPERIGTMLIARQVSRNYDGCALQDGSVEILGLMIGVKPVTRRGKPHYEVVTMEGHSAEFRQKSLLKAAEHFLVSPEEIHFYGGQLSVQEVVIIDA